MAGVSSSSSSSSSAGADSIRRTSKSPLISDRGIGMGCGSSCSRSTVSGVPDAIWRPVGSSTSPMLTLWWWWSSSSSWLVDARWCLVLTFSLLSFTATALASLLGSLPLFLFLLSVFDGRLMRFGLAAVVVVVAVVVVGAASSEPSNKRGSFSSSSSS